MDDDVAAYWFGDDCDTNEPEPHTFEYVPLHERIEALHHANASAKRLDGTAYWAGAHYNIDRLLDDIVGR